MSLHNATDELRLTFESKANYLDTLHLFSAIARFLATVATR